MPLLAEGGPRAVSLRAVASLSRVGPSSILRHLGTMEHLLRVSAHRTGLARREQLVSRWYGEGLLAHLPRLPDEVVEARVWLARCELWRSEPGPESTLGTPTRTSAPSSPGRPDAASDGPRPPASSPSSPGASPGASPGPPDLGVVR